MKKLIGSIILAITMLVSGTVLLAACDKNTDKEPASRTYTVSFYDGTTLKEEKKVEAGKTVAPPSMTDTDALHFVGWLINGEENNYFTEETAVQSDLNVYALWMPFVTVSFDLNGGDGTVDSINTYAGAQIILPLGEDLLFGDKGLYAWSDGDKEYVPGEAFSVGAVDTELYAVWGTRYTATFDLGDGTGIAPEERVSTRSVVLPDATGFSKAGYTFDGWMTSDGMVVKAGTIYPLTKNVSFTAVFAGTYTLTLDTPDGSVAEKTISRNTGDTYVLPTPARTGWKFLNWKQGEQTFAAGATFTFGYADVTLEAQWSDAFTVSYKDWDGYTFTTNSVKSGAVLPGPGSEFGLTEVAEFSGWKDAYGKEYTVDTTLVMADVVLYAQYDYTTYTVNDFSFKETDNGQAYLIEEVRSSFLGARTELYFPATFRGKPVIGTVDSTVEGATPHNFLKGTADATYTSSANSLHKVVIPSTWTVIGSKTFTNCRALTEIEINGQLERIGEWGFYYCYSLTSFTIPSSLRELSSNSFSACAKLENFVIDGENPNFSVQDGVLFNADKTELLCYNFGNARKDYVVPASVQTIASLAFDHRGNFNHPDTTSAAPDGAYNLTGSITFAPGSELQTICSNAFGYTHCTIALPASLRTVESYAFQSAEKAVTFEEGITELGAEAFRFYDGTSIALPATLQTIGESCFRGAFKLTSVTFPRGCNVTDIGAYAFTAAPEITAYPFNNDEVLQTIGEYAFSSPDSGTMGLEGEARFSSSLVSIGDYAFSRNSGIKSVQFGGGAKLTSIGRGAFGECTSLASVTFQQMTPLYQDIAPQTFYLCEALATVKLPAGVRRIGEQAFAGAKTRPNNALTDIEIPQTCRTIAAQAFAYNTKLKNVTFQDGGTNDLEIGAAFNGCTALEAFEVPARTKFIAVRVFEQVTTLKTITSSSELYPASDGALYEISTGTDGKQEKTLLYAYVDPTTHTLNVAEGTTRIAAYACAYNENLVTLNLPQSLTYIGGRAFTYTLNLETVTQSEGGAVKTIDDYAFSGSPATGGPSMKLKEFPFREGLEEIGTGAFQNNTGLTEVNLPASYHITHTTKDNILTGEKDQEMNTGGYAFSACTALRKITFADGCKLKELPIAFANWCSNLTTVVFGENAELEVLKGIAFMSCPKLTTVVLPMARVVDVLNNVFTSGDDSKMLSVTVYVADALVDSYQMNNNWKVNLAKCRPTFLPYSQYQAQTAE